MGRGKSVRFWEKEGDVLKMYSNRKVFLAAYQSNSSWREAGRPHVLNVYTDDLAAQHKMAVKPHLKPKPLSSDHKLYQQS